MIEERNNNENRNMIEERNKNEDTNMIEERNKNEDSNMMMIVTRMRIETRIGQ